MRPSWRRRPNRQTMVNVGPKRDAIVMLPSNRQHDLIGTGPDYLNRLGVAEALERLGWRVDFMDVNEAPLNPFAGRPSLFSAIDPLRALRILLARRRAFAVLSYYQSGVLIVLALRRLLGFKPLVVIVDIGQDEGWRIRTQIVRFCLARADAVFTFASAQAEYLSQKYGSDVVRFLPQQTDTDFFCPGPEPEEDFVLSVGADISRDYGTLKEAIFGLGLPVVLKTTLVEEDRERFPNVKVVRERLSDAAFRSLYRRAGIVAIPLTDTLYPGGITTLLESLACGKAVVVSDSRGVRDYLHHEENCLVVPCGDAGALRAAILRLMQDDALRIRLARNARAYAEKQLSQICHAERLAAAIRAAAARCDATE
jgi:glycosyltransferase involved in cell wall biosynthesis